MKEFKFMTIKEVKFAYNSGKYISKLDYPLNENLKSVKKYQDDISRLQNQMRKDITNGIILDYGFKEAQAKEIENFAFQANNPGVYSYFDSIEELCQLVKNIYDAE